MPASQLQRIRRRCQALAAQARDLTRDIDELGEGEVCDRLEHIQYQLDALLIEETNILLEYYWLDLES